MREIKFRGYSKDKRNWYYGFLSKEYNEEEEDYYYIDYEFGSPRVEEESIGQFTGFKDKNGVEIYEGDIIKVEKDKELYQVIFKEHIGQWQARGMSENTDDRLFQFSLHKCQVIGNIYEEKLKEGK